LKSGRPWAFSDAGDGKGQAPDPLDLTRWRLRLSGQVERPFELSLPELEQLADEVRAELVEVVSAIGGHLGSNLGTVELTIALHSLLNSPDDKIVWDVGHQAYVHKLLTGRRDRFPTIRQHGGLSPRPGKPQSPPCWRIVGKRSRRPASSLCTEAWWPTAPHAVSSGRFSSECSAVVSSTEP